MQAQHLILMVVLIFYFLPAINGFSKQHRSRFVILAANLFFGWTLLGWVLCLAWSAGSAKDDPEAPSERTHIRCPECAEFVLKAAKVCKHCGSRLSQQPPIINEEVQRKPRSREALPASFPEQITASTEPEDKRLPEKWRG